MDSAGTQSDPIIIDDYDWPTIVVDDPPMILPIVPRIAPSVSHPLYCEEELPASFIRDERSVAYPYPDIMDYFICEGWGVPKVVSITRRPHGMTIIMSGRCPIHDYHHTSNHFYLFWFNKQYAERIKDYISCHHGNEKENRILLDVRLPLAYLQ